MKVLTAKVVDGKINVGSDLSDGSAVAVLAISPELPRLTPEEEEHLAVSLAELRAGRYVDGQDLVSELKAKSRP
jgi:hypothetical protein